MTVSKASLSKVQYTTPIADLPDAATINSVANVGTSRGYNNGAATVSYTAVATGGTTTTFTATSSPGGYTGTGSSPITVEGLQSNTSYTFSMTGTNATGTGAAGSASSSITATTVPQAPTLQTPTITSVSEVSLPFTAGATGGSAITSYTITSSPSIALTYSGTTSPFSITGSYNAGIEYTFSVVANNANGSSTAAISSGITPNPQYSLNVDFLVVAGGGTGDGSSGQGGGGGGGGYRTSYSTSGKSSSPESKKSILSAVNYGVTVGAAGSNSVFADITSLAGGNGGGNGGSGGARGLGTENQGNNGGSGGAGGGGGAGQVGAGQGSTDSGGDPYPAGGSGGNGLASSIAGTSIFRAGGGGGHAGYTGGQAGPGQGGGSTANRGGGGQPASGGGSGVVVLRHDNAKTSTVGPGLTATSEVIGSEKVITITAGTGNVSWS